MRSNRIKTTLALGLVALLAGCSTLYKNATSVDSLGRNEVIVVGRIEFVPKVQVKEQNIDIGIDPFNAKDAFYNRAILYFSDKPTNGEKTREVYNPHLEETFFAQLPKNKNLMVYGSVYIKYNTNTDGRKVEVMLPAPIRLDIQSTDKAIYVGTWRFHRDEFGSITKFEVIDNYDKALAQFQKTFGKGTQLRKTLISAEN